MLSCLAVFEQTTQAVHLHHPLQEVAYQPQTSADLAQVGAEAETEMLGMLMGAMGGGGGAKPPPKPDGPVSQDNQSINLIENQRNMNLTPSLPMMQPP